MNRLLLPLLLFALIATVSSCNEEPDEQPQVVDPGNPVPNFNDMDGLFAAIQVISYQDLPFIGFTPVYADAATAVVFEDFNADLRYDAGDVSVNTYTLDKLDGPTYVLPSMNSLTELDFDFSTSSSNSWNIAGSNDVMAFTHTTSDEMPGDIQFDGDYSSVPAGSDLVVSIVNAPVNTDSILFVVAFNETTLTRTVGPNTTSATFTAAELDGASGTGVVQVAAYNYELEVINAKNYYFINESVISQVAQF